MKLIGLSFGRKMENTEILVKEALMGAEEFGVEVGMIRMLDLDIKPCKGCTACAQSLFGGGAGKCSIKDDMSFVDEQLMECDGVIIGSPVYIMTPTGLFKTVCDRLGPSHDVSFRMEAKKIGIAQGKDASKLPDERSYKTRIGAFISVGGASTPHWLSMGLPLMNLFTFPSHITVVDQMQVLGMSKYGSMVLNKGAIDRARQLGRHVAEAMSKPADEAKWMGDEEGTCPVCHSNLLTVNKKNPVECPICGISGKIQVNGDKISVVFDEEEKKRSRLTIAGKLEHWIELGESFKIMRQGIEETGKEEISRRLKKYRGYREIQVNKT